MAPVPSATRTRRRSHKSASTGALRSRVLTLLRDRELSRSELSRLANVSYDALRRLLREDANPALEHALRIGHALGVEVEELFALEVERRADARRTRGASGDPPAERS